MLTNICCTILDMRDKRTILIEVRRFTHMARSLCAVGSRNGSFPLQARSVFKWAICHRTRSASGAEGESFISCSRSSTGERACPIIASRACFLPPFLPLFRIYQPSSAVSIHFSPSSVCRTSIHPNSGLQSVRRRQKITTRDEEYGRRLSVRMAGSQAENFASHVGALL